MIYEELLDHVLRTGHRRPDRTGTDTHGIFGGRIVYDLSQAFPLITSKRVFWRGVVAELMWMLNGDTNIKSLQDQGVHIWDEWADDDGALGPVYGEQWRNWTDSDGYGEEDQIANVIHSLEHDPFSRRHLVSAWHVNQLGYMALAPCHFAYQFYVREDDEGQRRLSIQVYQRSADMFLGVPFNLASYALLTHLVAHHLGYRVDKLIWIGGDVHIYSNHLSQVDAQLANHSLDPRPLPQLSITGEVFDQLYALRQDQFDIHLSNYNPHRTITAPVAV